jgi:hypothetical protein
MNTINIKEMIDFYFDGELEKGKEPILFTLLSGDEEARDYFKKLNFLKAEMISTLEEYPSQLDEKVLRSISKINEKQSSILSARQVFSVITYTVTVVLLILTIFFYSKSEEYQVQFSSLTREVKEQNDKLELLMNALPQVEVTSGYLRTKQIVVTAQEL